MGEPEKGSVFPPNSQFQPDWEEAGEVSPELGHPEQQPWARDAGVCLPFPGQAGSGEPGLDLLYDCS